MSGLDRDLRFFDRCLERRTIVAGTQPRLEAREHFTSADPIADRWQLLGHDAPRGRRCDDGLATGHGMEHGGHTYRRPHVSILNRGGRELVRPLLLLQVRNRRGVFCRPLARFRVGRRFVGVHLDGAEIVPVGQAGRVQDQGPAIAASSRRRALDAERSGPRRLRTLERGRLSSGSRRELHARLT